MPGGGQEDKARVGGLEEWDRIHLPFLQKGLSAETPALPLSRWAG